MKLRLVTMVLVGLLVGCAVEPGPDVEEVLITVGGEERYALALVPSGEPGMPLVFDLHGWGGTAEGQMRETRMDEVARREGFIVIYPQAREPELLWAADNVAFIEALLDLAIEEYAADSAQVYITGFSAGGFATHYLGAALSDRVAAIAPVGGIMPDYPDIAAVGGEVPVGLDLGYTLPPEPPRAVPVLIIHGLGDEIVPYAGVPPSVQVWSTWNGCTGEPEKTAYSENVTHEVYTACEAPIEVYSFAAEDNDHIVPGEEEGLPAAEVIWDFFEMYRLP